MVNDIFQIVKLAAVSLVLCVCVFLTDAGAITYINISNPFVTKTPVAVTEFKALTGHAQETRDGKTAKSILEEALDFTGYLKTMNPVAFLSNPAETGIELGQIQFRDWTGIGAELLITGGILEKNGSIMLELRLIDTFNTRSIVGNRYTGPRSKIRKMIHRFCGDVAFALTGQRGIFDSRIAFVSTVDGHKEIFTCDFDGQNIQPVTSHKNISISPAWSSDGRWLAYVSYVRGRPDIYIRNLTEKRGAVINYKGMNISPGWMPGKDLLAAALSFSGDQEIYLLTLKGDVVKRLTNSPGIDVSPAFSPDGKKIAFTSKRSGTPQIYIKDLETLKAQRLTFKGANNTSPSWSPDGRRIAYVGIDGNEINIFVMQIDSGMPVQLTMDAGDNEDPSWSPDGSMLAFTSTRKGGMSKIFVMNASGTDQRPLFDAPGKQSQPDWSSPDTAEE